ncbi:MAG: polyprenyl diphosphate synthase [Parachlamydia sp.]|jgi:undecaprenyl diphosphate synthase|nr:polyprenyl diphosphate synthase [Parachlamydia sp.]
MTSRSAVAADEKLTARFHPSLLEGLDRARIPKHIAIIPDGNRRWAKKKLSEANDGHREGADTLMETVKAAIDLGVEKITFYSFSTENWSRTQEEIFALLALMASYLIDQKNEMIESGIKLETIGEPSSFPAFLKQAIQETKIATEHCTKISLILALNYGARNEICRAFKAMLDDYDHRLLAKEEVDEKMIASYLDTHAWQDPELLIRTSGEMRISNFLLWQISYTEIHVSPVLWPDFTPDCLLEAVLDYQARDRRLGGC